MWATHKYDVGLIKGAEPIKITPKRDFHPNLLQYPLKPEAVWGITVFHSFLGAGVIVPCQVHRKARPCFCQKDSCFSLSQWLEVFNIWDQVTLLSTPEHWTCPTPMPFCHKSRLNNQFRFAFEFNGKPYTFTRMYQGYCESPTIYNNVFSDVFANDPQLDLDSDFPDCESEPVNNWNCTVTWFVCLLPNTFWYLAECRFTVITYW